MLSCVLLPCFFLSLLVLQKQTWNWNEEIYGNVLRCKSLHCDMCVRMGKKEEIQARVKFHYYYNFHNVINKRILCTKKHFNKYQLTPNPLIFHVIAWMGCCCCHCRINPVWFINSCIEMLKNNIRSWIIVCAFCLSNEHNIATTIEIKM